MIKGRGGGLYDQREGGALIATYDLWKVPPEISNLPSSSALYHFILWLTLADGKAEPWMIARVRSVGAVKRARGYEK